MRHNLRKRLMASFLLFLFVNNYVLLANPTGGTVTSGSATIQSSGTTLSINQTTQRAIIEWQGFSIGAGETTKFLQPSLDAVTLNRVISANPSLLYGSLQANGKVILINQNGIVVGPGGRIDTAGFIGSTLNIADQDFLAGDLKFIGNSDAAVLNLGTINAIGGDVYLLAANVENRGTIRAPQGTVGLAAGKAVKIVEAGNEKISVLVGPDTAQAVGVDNKGLIEAVSAELKAAGGNIYALAINQEGIVRASTVVNEGGRIYLKADGNVVNTGTLNASGTTGGEVLVNGQNITLSPSALINVDGTAGNAGTVNVLAEDTTVFNGFITARALSLTGNGGNVEVSGLNGLLVSGTVDLRAAKGAAGTLLLDPGAVSIIHGGIGGADATNYFTDAWITNQLALGSLTISTANATGGGAQNLTVSNTVDIAWNNANSLTFIGSNSVTVESGASIVNDGTGGLNLISGGDVIQAGTITLAGTLTVNAGGAVTYNNSLKAAVIDSRSGNDGSGDTTFGAGVTISADSQSYRAGSGSGTTARLDLVSNGPQFLNATGGAVLASITYRQDAAIVGADLEIGGITASPLAVTIQSDGGGITFTNSDFGGTTLRVTALGDILQTGWISNSGVSFFTSAGNVLLTDSGNGFGPVTLVAGGDAWLAQAGGITLAGANVVSNLSLVAAGDVTQGGAITNRGLVKIDAGSFNVTLADANNDFESFSVTAANNVSVRDVNAIDLGQTTLGGSLAVRANGAITQSGGPLAVTGTTSLQADGGAITLTDGGNTFSGAVTITNTGANNVTLNNATALILGGSVGGNLSLDVAGSVSQAGALAVTGSTTVVATGGVGLTNAANQFRGAVTLNSSADSAVSNNNTLTIGGTVGGSLVVSAAGAITNNSVSVTGTLTEYASGDVRVNGSLMAGSIWLYSGTDGSGNISFGAGVTNRADVQLYQAGNGAGSASANLTGNTPQFRNSAGTGAPVGFGYQQAASISDANLPTAAQFGGAAPSNYVLWVDNGDLTISTASKVAGSDLRLRASGTVSIEIDLLLASLSVTGGTININNPIGGDTPDIGITTVGSQRYDAGITGDDNLTLTASSGTIAFRGGVALGNNTFRLNGDVETTHGITFAASTVTFNGKLSISGDSNAGTLTVNANLAFTSNATYYVTLNGLATGTGGATGYDRLRVTGNNRTVTLGGATLTGESSYGSWTDASTVDIITLHHSGSTISGNWNPASSVSIDGNTFGYLRQNGATGYFRLDWAEGPWIWTGAGASTNAFWSNPANWQSGSAPTNQGALVIFKGNIGLSSSNDLVNTFSQITFDSGAGAFTLNGSPLLLSGGINNDSTALQTFTLQISLAGDVSLTAAAGPMTFAGEIPGNGYALALSGANGLTFDNTVGTSSSRLGSLVADGPVAFNGGGVWSTGPQTYFSTVTFGNAATLSGSSIALLTNVNGNGQQVVIEGNATLGMVGAGHVLTNFGTLTVTGTATNNAVLVSATDSVIFDGALVLATNATLSGGNYVEFHGPVSGAYDLTLVAGSNYLGGMVSVASLDVTGDTALAGGSVVTTGAQTFRNLVQLEANTLLNGGTISLLGNMNGQGYNLTLVGPVTMGDALSDAVSNLGNLVVSNAITIGAGSVHSHSNQTYVGTVTLSNDPTMSSGGNIELLGGLTSAGALHLSAGGTNIIASAVSVGTLTASGTTELNGAPVVTANGQTYNGAVVLSADTALTNTGAGAVTFNSTVAAGANSLTLVANGMDFSGGTGSVAGVSTLTLQPLLATDSIGIGAGAAGTLHLSATDIAALADGWAGIVIGRADGQHAIDVRAVTFVDPVTIRTPVAGSITVNGQITGNDNASVTLNGSGATTTLNADIITAGNAITINDAVVLGTPSSVNLDTTAAATVPVGADIQIAGTINDVSTTSGLVLKSGSSGTITLDREVGDVTPIAELKVYGNQLRLDGGSVTTVNGQTYNGSSIVLGANTTLSSTDGGSFFAMSSIDADAAANNRTLSVSTEGTKVFLADIGGVQPLASFAVSGAGHAGFSDAFSAPLQLNADVVNMQSDVLLVSDLSIVCDTVTFGQRLSTASHVAPQQLTINAIGTATFNGAIGAVWDDGVGNTKPLAGVSVTAGAINLNGGMVTTSGSQLYVGPVTIGTNAALTSTGGGTIQFSSTVNSDTGNNWALTLSTAGVVGFGGSVGSVDALSSLDVTGSLIALGGSTVSTTGAQDYNGALVLGVNVQMNGTTVTFDGTVDGAHDLTVTGAATFNGPVGTNAPLANLTVNNTTVLNGGTVTVTGTQYYNGGVTLGNNATLSAASIIFGYTLNGAYSLTATGSTHFSDTVGMSDALQSITVNGPVTFDAGWVRTIGAQTYNGAATLTDSLSVDASTLTFNSTVNGGWTLSSLAGDTVLNGTVSVGTLNIAGTATLNGGTITTTGDQTFQGAVALGANTTLDSAGNVLFASTVNSDPTARNLTVDATGSVVFSNAVGGASALATLSLAGDSVFFGSTLNDVGTLTVGLTGSGNGVDFTDVNALSIAGITTVNGPVVLTVDTLDIAAAIDAGTARVTLRPLTTGRQISLGTETAGQLSLADAELDYVTAGVLQVGSATAGTITISAAISPANSGTLSLVNGAAVIETGAGALTVSNLKLDSTGAALFTGTNNAGTIAVAASTLTFVNSSLLTVGTVDGLVGVTSAGNVVLTADDLEISAKIDPARVTLQPLTAGTQITLGGSGSGMSLTDAELDLITATVLQVGNATAGSINIGGEVTLDPSKVSTLSLVTAASVTQADDAALSVNSLAIRAAGPVSLNATNSINSIAALLTGLEQGISVSATSTLSVSTVDGLTGITTTNGAVTFAADSLDLSALVDAGTNRITIQPFHVLGISLGGSESNRLTVTGGGLAQLLAGIVQIGSTNTTLDVAINGAVTLARPGTLVLEAAGSVTQDDAAPITASNLVVRAGGSVDLMGVNVVNNLAAQVSGDGAGFAFLNNGALLVTNVDGVNGILTSSGTIHVQTVDGALTVAENILAGNAGIFLKAGGLNRPLTILDGTTVEGRGLVELAADNVVFDTTAAIRATDAPQSNGVTEGVNVVWIRPATDGTTVDLGGADAAGVLGVSQSDLNRVTADVIRVGSTNAGPMAITAPIVITAANAYGLSLKSGGNIDQANSTTVALNVPYLAIEAGPYINLLSTSNRVEALAVKFVGGGGYRLVMNNYRQSYGLYGPPLLSPAQFPNKVDGIPLGLDPKNAYVEFNGISISDIVGELAKLSYVAPVALRLPQLSLSTMSVQIPCPVMPGRDNLCISSFEVPSERASTVDDLRLMPPWKWVPEEAPAE